MFEALVVLTLSVIAMYHLFPEWSSYPLLVDTSPMLEWVAILTHHDLHVFASLCSKALVNAAHRTHHRSASMLPWTTSDLCQCCIALDLLKWEGALLVALMPSSCLILSGYLRKH